MKNESLLLKEHPYLFGLSRKAPQVLPSGITSDAITKAEVDIYLDQLEGINLKTVEASLDTEPSNLFVHMADARRNALHMMESDMLAAMLTLYGSARKRYAGSIGGYGSSTGVNVGPEGRMMELKLTVLPDRGAVMRLKRIGLLLDSDASVDVYVSGQPEAFTVVATADTPSYFTLPEPVLIDLASLKELTVSYETGAFYPRNNVVSCGCSVMDSLLNDYFHNALSQPAYGVLLDVEVYCDSRAVITKNIDASAEIETTMAYAARFKAGELLIESIVASGKINRYTMLGQEHLWGKRNHFRKEYQDRINWLVSSDGVDTSFSACYPCKQRNANGYPMGRILL